MIQEPESNWFNTTILQSLDGFFDWSIVTGHVSLSVALKKLLGYQRNELNGNNKDFFEKNIHPEDLSFLENEFSAFLNSLRDNFKVELRMLNKNKEYLWLRINGIALRDIEGNPLRFVAIITDIHDYKKELELSVQSSESKSKFIASLNHELRSPLASIISTANFMLEDNISEKHKLFVQNIISSADMLITLVNDILDVSKIAAGKLTLEARPISIREILDHVQEIVRPQYTKKGLFLQRNIDKAIPPFIIGDITRIKQIILNLCTNAIKFTQSGGIYINTKYTRMTDFKGKLYFEILDSGIGIPNDRIKMLFQDYNQADISTSRKYGGTGLGLSICKKLVDLMGGKIAVSSKENIGSSFWFEIPVEIPMETPLETQKYEMKEVKEEKTSTTNNSYPSKSEITLNSITPLKVEEKKGGYMTTPFLEILVAEDNMVNQAVIQGLLEKLGHKVTIAQDGQEAVQWYSAKQFDIILMDINMPVMNGIDACKQIRKVDQDIPIIAVTANTLDEGRDNCIAAGMNGFSTKPIDKQKLQELLKPYLEKKYAPQVTSSGASSASPSMLNSEIIYIDRYPLKQLIEDLGVERIQKFVTMYRNDAPKLIQNLQSNMELEHSAHTLAGMSENLSFVAIGKKSRDLLNKIREGKIDESFTENVQKLPGLYDKTLKAAEELLMEPI